MSTETCSCGGAGWMLDRADPYAPKLVACVCVRDQRATARRQKLLERSGMLAFQGATFAEFDATRPGVAEAFVRSQQFALAPDGWLFLTGPWGCGKTHLAMSIANEALAQDAEVLFYVAPDLLRSLKATWDKGSEVSYEEQFNFIRDIELLLIDDLGAENATDWTRQEFFQLLNHRYERRLPTVITSNLALKDIEPRLRSRLGDTGRCEILALAAADYRALTPAQRRARQAA